MNRSFTSLFITRHKFWIGNWCWIESIYFEEFIIKTACIKTIVILESICHEQINYRLIISVASGIYSTIFCSIIPQLLMNSLLMVSSCLNSCIVDYWISRVSDPISDRSIFAIFSYRLHFCKREENYEKLNLDLTQKNHFYRICSVKQNVVVPYT